MFTTRLEQEQKSIHQQTILKAEKYSEPQEVTWQILRDRFLEGINEFTGPFKPVPKPKPGAMLIPRWHDARWGRDENRLSWVSNWYPSLTLCRGDGTWTGAIAALYGVLGIDL